jgi:cation:H+ antiporter
MSGMGNLIFAWVLASRGGDGNDVLTNCLFNNVTNLTLLVGIPMLIWQMTKVSDMKTSEAVCQYRVGRLSEELSLISAFFFALFIWLLASDGKLTNADGWILVLLFIFWQCFHVYDTRKTNLLKKRFYPKTIVFELISLLVCAYAIYLSTNCLVEWFTSLDQELVPPRMLGWFSGALMVLPNALLAAYYGARKRMDIVYISQIGDAHVCVPLCVGVFAVFHAFEVGAFLMQSLLIVMAICAVHLIFITVVRRFSRMFGLVFVSAFFVFIWLGLFK